MPYCTIHRFSHWFFSQFFIQLILLAGLFTTVYCQGEIQVDYGLSAKFDVGKGNNTNYILSASIGFGRSMVTRLDRKSLPSSGIMLSFKAGINLYRGGIGNSKMPGFFDDHQLDLYGSFGATPGFFWNKPMLENFNYRRPLYTWNTNYANTLSNPFQFSFTLASNFIWNIPINGDETEGQKELQKKLQNEERCNVNNSTPAPIESKFYVKKRRSQRIGYIGVALDRYLSAGYYNDGPPFSEWLGDGYDRYWTGGGFAHIWSQERFAEKPLNEFKDNFQLIISFDKFTGYEKDTYEVANKLKLNKVPYKNIETASYNRGITRAALIYREIGFFVSKIDSKAGKDIQDRIHKINNYPYHPNMYKDKWLFGLNYQYQNSIYKK